MRWITLACVMVAFVDVARAAPIVDDQRGQARDTFRDFVGVDTSSPLTFGVVNNAAANLVRLETPDTLGSLLTHPYEPLSASGWRKVYLAYTAAASDDIALAVYDASGNLIQQLPLTPTAQAGFKAEANLAGLPLATYPALRFAITLDGVGAPFAPTLEDLLVTWAPRSQLELGAATTRSTLCAGDTFTIDVPVSVSYVPAQGLVVKVDKPVASDNTHPVAALEVVAVSHAQSATSPGRVAFGNITFDALTVEAGEVYWAFNAPVPSGSSMVFSVTYRVPSGIDHGTRFTTRARADANNADAVAAVELGITTTSSAIARVIAGFDTIYADNDTTFANQGETITAHVRLENTAPGLCGQTLHDVVVVDGLSNFVGVIGSGEVPTSISHGGTFIPTGITASFFGQPISGPAVVWTVPSLEPGAARDLSYRLTLSEGAVDGLTPSRSITAISTFDGTRADTTRSLTIGLPDEANGGFALGQRYLGVSEVNGLRDDLAGLVIPSGSAFTYALTGVNHGLSSLDGVYLVFPIPDGLEFLDASASSESEIFYNDAPLGSAIPDFIGGALGPSWTDDPEDLPTVRWVAARADLVSRYFGAAGATGMWLDVDVVETAVGGGCSPAEYNGQAFFTISGYVPVGETVAIPHSGDLVIDEDVARTAPAQPRIRDFQVNRDVGQRLGAGRIVYTIRVSNDGSAIDTIDAGRDAVLAIDLPRVELAGGPGYLPLVSLQPRDGQPDTTDLVNGKVYVRWPYLAPRSTRDVELVVDWPAGGLNGTVAELRAHLTVPDDVCAPQTATGATTTTLVVRPALTVTKSVDLDAALPGSQLVYDITATNNGDGAATETVLFDRLPVGLSLVRVIPGANTGTVYVSNALPPTLPSGYANPSILTQALVDAHFVPAIPQGDGSWTSPIAGVVWVAVDLDDPSLTPSRFVPGKETTVQIVASMGPLPALSTINNRAALDAGDVTAAISAAGRTLVSGEPSARVTRDMPRVIASGETFTYTVTVTNSGTVTGTGLTLAEALPPGVTFVDATFIRNGSGTTVTPTFDSLTETITADLGAGIGSLEGGTLTITVLADEGLQTGDVLAFLARATLANPSNPDGTSFEAGSNVRVSTADLQASLSLDRLDPLAGETVTASLTIVNAGEHHASNPTVSLRIPADLAYVPGSTLVSGGYILGEPTTVPVFDGAELVGYDLVWSDLAPSSQPGGPIPGLSSPAVVTVRLELDATTPPETPLPLTLTIGTTTGQGGATDNDTATVVAMTPEADPFVAIESPTAAKPGQNVAVVVRYGNMTRQSAGATAIVVALPNDEGAVANRFVRATANNAETILYFVGTPGAVLTPPTGPTSGWSTTPSAGVTHVAILTNELPGLATRSVTLESKLTTTTGELVEGGTHHPVCARSTSVSDGDMNNNEACKTIDVPGLNLTASLSSTPTGTSPGVVVGGSVTHTATIANTGLAPSFGNWFELDRGTLTPTSTLPNYAEFTGVAPNGAPISQRIPLTVVGNRIYLGTNGGASDPLDYRNVGLPAGASLTMTFTSTVPDTTPSRAALTASLTVGTDYRHDYLPGSSDPELATDNVATTSVTAYRPDLFVSMRATDPAGSTSPVARGEHVLWTVTYDNIGDIAASDATLTSTIASGTAFVVGSITDAPPGFAIEYLGPSGWGYTPAGAVGTVDPNVRAVRMSGSDLATPLNPSYSASAAALEAGTIGGNTRWSNGRVAANSTDGDTWTSELVTHPDLAQWTRVTFTGRGGDDPMTVTVLDSAGTPIPGYVDMALDSSDTIDISGIDASAHPSLRFVVSFQGSSPVCDLTAGRGISLGSGPYVTPYTHEFQNPEGVAIGEHSFRAGPTQSTGVYREVGGQWKYVATENATVSSHLACNDEACVRPYAYQTWDGVQWRVYRGLAFETPEMSQSNALSHELPWLESDDYALGWDQGGATPMRWGDQTGALVAAALIPSPDQDPGPGDVRVLMPYVVRYTYPSVDVEALPLLDAGALHDFDDQGYTTPDTVFGRELGGDAIMWTRAGGVWSASPITRPVDAIGDATIRTAPDRAAACISFATATTPLAYLVTPSATTTLGAYACEAAFDEGRFILRGVDTLLYDADAASTAVLPDADGAIIKDVAGGAGAARNWVLGTVGGDVVVWIDSGGYSSHVIATDATKVFDIDAQGVVYLVDDNGVFVGLVVAPDGTSTVVPMTPAGWMDLIEVRRVREGVFAGLTTGTGTLLGIGIVSYDATTGSLDGFSQPGERRPTANFARTTRGSTVGGGVTIDSTSGEQRPALWTANGEGPDGWGLTVLPTLEGASGEQRVLGMDKEDPTVVVGMLGQTIVSWTKGPSGWTVHPIVNGGIFGNGPQGQYSAMQYDATLPIFPTSAGYLYIDPSSATGVRLLDWYYYQIHPELNMTWAPNGTFSMQEDAGVPMFVTGGAITGGSFGPIVLYYEGDTLQAERLPGNGNAFHTHSRKPLITGQSTDQNNSSRPTLWRRVDGTWTREFLSQSNGYGLFVMDDESVFANVAGSNTYLQKRNGVWQSLPVDVSFSWSDQRVPVLDNGILTNHFANGQGNIVWVRPPRAGENAAKKIVVANSYNGAQTVAQLHHTGPYLGDGLVIGSRLINGNWAITKWRINDDDSVTETVIDPSGHYSWGGSDYPYSATPRKSHSVRLNGSGAHHLWVDGQGGGTIVDTFPSDYSGNKSDITATPYGDIYTYSWWMQGRAYGCWLASDASFTGFAVGYRNGTPPTFTFSTVVLDEGCINSFEATTTAATIDPDGDLANDMSTASIGFEHAELVTALRTSRSVAPVGSTLSYHGEVTNSGPSSASNVTVTFTDPDGVTTSTVIANLAVGARWLFDLDYDIPGSVDGTVISGVLEAVSDTTDCDPDDDLATASTVVSNLPNAWVTLDGPNSAAIGVPITLTVTYGNDGAVPTDGGTIELALPSGLTFVNPSDAVLIVPAMNPGEQHSVLVQVVAGPVLAGKTVDSIGTINVTGDVLGGDDIAVLATRFSDTNGALGVAVYGSQGTARPGEEVNFVVLFDNHGEGDASGTSLVVSLPAGTYVAGSSTGVYDAGAHTLTWTLGELAAGSDGAVGFALTGTTDLVVTANISAAIASSATATTTVVVGGGLQVAATADRLNVGVGTAPGNVEWTVMVHNDGATTWPVTLADLVPAGATYIPGSITGPGANDNGAPELQWSFDLPAGATRVLTFRTTAPTEDTVNTPSGSNGAPVNVREVAAPSLITTTSAEWVLVGDTLSVTIAYTNPGPAVSGATLRQFLGEGFTLVEAGGAIANAEGLTWPLGALASGASGSVTFTLAPDSAGPFQLAGASLTSSGAPQLSNTTFGVAVAPCTLDEPCLLDTIVPNVGCVPEEAAVGQVVEGTTCNALSVSLYPDRGSVGSDGEVGFAVFFANRAGTLVSGAELVVSLPSGSYVPGSSTGSYDATAHTLTWTLGDLPAGGSGAVNFTLAASEDSIALSASASLTASATQTTSAESASVPVLDGLRVSASVDHVYVGAGSSATNQTWTILVHNDGAATTVNLLDRVPELTRLTGGIDGPGLDPNSIDWTAVYAGAPVDLLWTFEIGADESRTFAFQTEPATGDTVNLPLGGNEVPSFRRDVAEPTLISSLSGTWFEVGQQATVSIAYSNPGPAVTGATLRQLIGADLVVVDAGLATPVGSVLEWSLGDLASGASGIVTFTFTATTAGPFVLDRPSLTSSGLPQVGNQVFGVMAGPCSSVCGTGIVVANVGCVVEATSNLAVAMSATDTSGGDGPVAAAGEVVWSIELDNECNRAANDVVVTATIAAGSGFVVGSLSGISDDFLVEYLDASGSPITVSGADGTVDPMVASIRLSGTELPTAGYVATAEALEAGTSPSTTYANGRVGAVDGEGVWLSELITPTDLAGWSRVTIGDREGDDPIVVRVLDALGNVVPGYEQVLVDPAGRVDIDGIDVTTYPALQFEVTLRAASGMCDLAAGRGVQLDMPYGEGNTIVRTSMGMWLGGEMVNGPESYPTIWSPNGQGPDGWGATILPGNPTSSPQTVLGLNHDDPTVAIGVIGGTLVSWTKGTDGSWNLHVIGPGSANEAQGRSMNGSPTDRRPGLATSAGGYIYYDPSSATGVRHLNPQASIPGVDYVAWVRTIAMDGDLPMLIASGSLNGESVEFAVRFEGESLVAERIGTFVLHAAPSTARVVGSDYFAAEDQYRAARHTRINGAWTTEYLDPTWPGHGFAERVMSDDNVYATRYSADWSTTESVFFQKRAGTWQSFPTGITETPMSVRTVSNDGYILAEFYEADVRKLVAVRPPRPDESASKRIDITVLSDANDTYAWYQGYLAGGRVLGMRSDAGMVIWQINQDDTVTEVVVANDKYWGSVQDLPPEPTALPVYDAFGRVYLWIPGSGVGTLVAAYPDDYASNQGQSPIVPTSTEGLLTFDNWYQGRAYGCWTGSDARFGSFSVGYRSGSTTSPSFSFRTEVLADTCIDALEAEVTITSSSEEGTYEDNGAEASIDLAVSDLVVTLSTNLETPGIGQTMTFIGMVTNSGPAIADDVVVTFTGPGDPISINIGTLAPGGVYNFSNPYLVTPADVGTTLVATLGATTSSLDCDESDNVATATAMVDGQCADSETLCDGLDDDCDGEIDEGLTRGTSCGQGACQNNVGVETCVLGDWVNDTCDPFAGATAETCDNVDNDCDGSIDEDLTQQTTCGQGACQNNVGTETCVAGTWSNDTCAPFQGATAETCDNIDNDCDGNIDEDLATNIVPCVLAGGCDGTIETTCQGGLMVGVGECQIPDGLLDLCDGLDNDCDSQTDEDFAPEPIACGVDACAVGNGLTTCENGVLGDTCEPLWSEIPDTTCGSGTTGQHVAYILVTDATGTLIGSVRCHQDLSAPNTPVTCDTDLTGTLIVYPELYCEGVAP